MSGAAQITPKAGKRYPMNLRTTFDVRQKLETAAKFSGRSLSAEVEHRVEESIRQDDVFGGPGLRRVAYTRATAFAGAGQHSAGRGVPFKDWSSANCITAVASVVVALAKLTHLSDADLENLGLQINGQLATLRASREVDK
jgi:hypothetical protein